VEVAAEVVVVAADTSKPEPDLEAALDSAEVEEESKKGIRCHGNRLNL
jgi:hypothetical protein